MKRVAVFIGAAALFVAGSASAEPGVRIAALPRPLSWQAPALDSKLSDDGTLAITAGKGTDWFNWPGGGDRKAGAPRLVFEADDDFVLSAKVDVDFRTVWDAGGLALIADDAHWAKLCFEFTNDHHPAVISVVTRDLSDDAGSVPVDGQRAWLKIAKFGGVIFFYASADGRTWTIVRKFALPAARRLQVGFVAQAPDGERLEARFSDIRYQPGPPDLWKLN
jgi:uncharacterized protein